MQLLVNLIRLFADLGELAHDLGHIYCADGRTSSQTLLDQLGSFFIVQVGEKGRRVEDTGRTFQSGV